jgi:hypothetical protein
MRSWPDSGKSTSWTPSPMLLLSKPLSLNDSLCHENEPQTWMWVVPWLPHSALPSAGSGVFLWKWGKGQAVGSTPTVTVLCLWSGALLPSGFLEVCPPTQIKAPWSFAT